MAQEDRTLYSKTTVLVSLGDTFQGGRDRHDWPEDVLAVKQARDASGVIFTATQNVNLMKEKAFAEKASKHAADLLFPPSEVRELCEAFHLIRCNVKFRSAS
jgi:hypothetical protein